MGRIILRAGTRSDNDGLLALTSATPLEGAMSVRLDRNPDFFRMLDRRGPSVLIVAERDGVLVGSLSASRMRAYVDGREREIHLLADFKLAAALRGSGVAVRLLRAMHERLAMENADIVVGHTAVGNRLVEPFHGGRAGLLTSRSIGVFRILQALPRRSSGTSGERRAAEEGESAELLSLLDARSRRHQFGPVMSPAFLRGCRYWTVRGVDGRLHAAVALADVGDSRQNVLLRLPLALRVVSAALRGSGRFLPFPEVPRIGQPIRTLYIKAIAWADGCEAAIAPLVRAARGLAFEGGYHFLSIGLHERDPLLRHFARTARFTFRAEGFVVGVRTAADTLEPPAVRVPAHDFSLG